MPNYNSFSVLFPVCEASYGMSQSVSAEERNKLKCLGNINIQSSLVHAPAKKEKSQLILHFHKNAREIMPLFCIYGRTGEGSLHWSLSHTLEALIIQTLIERTE